MLRQLSRRHPVTSDILVLELQLLHYYLAYPGPSLITVDNRLHIDPRLALRSLNIHLLSTAIHKSLRLDAQSTINYDSDLRIGQQLDLDIGDIERKEHGPRDHIVAHSWEHDSQGLAIDIYHIADVSYIDGLEYGHYGVVQGGHLLQQLLMDLDNYLGRVDLEQRLGRVQVCSTLPRLIDSAIDLDVLDALRNGRLGHQGGVDIYALLVVLGADHLHIPAQGLREGLNNLAHHILDHSPEHTLGIIEYLVRDNDHQSLGHLAAQVHLDRVPLVLVGDLGALDVDLEPAALVYAPGPAHHQVTVLFLKSAQPRIPTVQPVETYHRPLEQDHKLLPLQLPLVLDGAQHDVVQLQFLQDDGRDGLRQRGPDDGQGQVCRDLDDDAWVVEAQAAPGQQAGHYAAQHYNRLLWTDPGRSRTGTTIAMPTPAAAGHKSPE